jgi:hypothetical protein
MNARRGSYRVVDRGRECLPPDECLIHTITVRLTEEQYEHILTRAGPQGTISSTIRSLIELDVHLPDPSPSNRARHPKPNTTY